MQVPFLNLAAQFDALREETLTAVGLVLAGGHYVLGPNVAALEAEVAKYVGATFGVGVNSGSDALTLALRALEIGPGDEVITTPFTYIAPAESISRAGQKRLSRCTCSGRRRRWRRWVGRWRAGALP